MDYKTVTLQELLAVQKHLVEQAGQRVVDTSAAAQDTGAVDASAVAGWDTSAAVHSLAAAIDYGLGDADHSLERESRR